jgi:hypothetical protein
VVFYSRNCLNLDLSDFRINMIRNCLNPIHLLILLILIPLDLHFEKRMCLKASKRGRIVQFQTKGRGGCLQGRGDRGKYKAVSYA